MIESSPESLAQDDIARERDEVVKRMIAHPAGLFGDMGAAMTDEPKSQTDKFKEVASALECDEVETAWDARLKKVAAHKPVEDKAE